MAWSPAGGFLVVWSETLEGIRIRFVPDFGSPGETLAALQLPLSGGSATLMVSGLGPVVGLVSLPQDRSAAPRTRKLVFESVSS